MTTQARQYDAVVLRRDQLSPHLVRLVLGGDALAGFTSTGVPDEWVGLVVPGQFQSRYYTVRSCSGSGLVLDVVVHDEGLVTGWASGDCVGDHVVVTEPQSAFDPPATTSSLVLVGDLTALPAMRRISGKTGLPWRAWAEVPAGQRATLASYLPGDDVTWLETGDGASRLAEVVADLPRPDDTAYFWMAGESAQMRAVRKHVMREWRLPAASYHCMGYWRAGATRRPRAVDPGPIYRAGKAAGKTDEQIWAEFDEARS